MKSLVAQIADQLIARGALKPTPGSDHPDVKIFRPFAPYPATEGIVRFYRVTAKGETPSQHFLDWQSQVYIPLALEVYMPHRAFLQWMRGTLPELTANPLSPAYRDMVGNMLDKLVKLWSREVACSFLGDMEHKKPATHPAADLDKEGRAELIKGMKVLRDHPEILHTVALYQGMQLHFLHDLIQELETKDRLSAKEVRVLPKTIEMLASMFDTARFFSVALWTGIAYAERQEEGKGGPDMLPVDFAAGWAKLREGGGFSTKHDTRITKCPFEKVGSYYARSELCSRPEAKVVEADQTAHGLWCIYQMIRRGSAPGEGPHGDSLTTIRDVLRTGTLEDIYSEKKRGESFRSGVSATRKRIRIKAVRRRFPARVPVEAQERRRELVLA